MLHVAAVASLLGKQTSEVHKVRGVFPTFHAHTMMIKAEALFTHVLPKLLSSKNCREAVLLLSSLGNVCEPVWTAWKSWDLPDRYKAEDIYYIVNGLGEVRFSLFSFKIVPKRKIRQLLNLFSLCAIHHHSSLPQGCRVLWLSSLPVGCWKLFNWLPLGFSLFIAGDSSTDKRFGSVVLDGTTGD